MCYASHPVPHLPTGAADQTLRSGVHGELLSRAASAEPHSRNLIGSESNLQHLEGLGGSESVHLVLLDLVLAHVQNLA